LRRLLKNYEMSSDGKKEISIALADEAIAEQMFRLIAPSDVFALNGQLVGLRNGKLTAFVSEASFFGWLRAHQFAIDWMQKSWLVTKAEFVRYLLTTRPSFTAVLDLPHEPPLEGVYYTAEPKPAAYTGRLDELVNMWTPATEDDRAFVKAAFITPVWGGSPGRRPGIFVENDGLDNGRGIGKSTLIYTIGKLCDGFIDCEISDSVTNIKERMLSGIGNKRIVTFDNVKTCKFSSGDIEKLITAPEISAHKMFVGERTVPNHFTYCFSMNEPSLSADLAQRALRIRLARAPWGGSWLEKIDHLVEKCRDDILGDIIWILRQSPVAFSGDKNMRFADWQRGVLSKINPTHEIVTTINGRQAAVDADAEDAEEIEEIFEMNIRRYKNPYGMHASEDADPDRSHYWVSRAVAAEWVIKHFGGRMNFKQAHEKIRRAKLARLRPAKDGSDYHRFENGRFYHFRRRLGDHESPAMWGLNAMTREPWGYLIDRANPYETLKEFRQRPVWVGETQQVSPVTEPAAAAGIDKPIEGQGK
jgi:hypothetical protein